jgi:hypothetical protein
MNSRRHAVEKNLGGMKNMALTQHPNVDLYEPDAEPTSFGSNWSGGGTAVLTPDSDEMEKERWSDYPSCASGDDLDDDEAYFLEDEDDDDEDIEDDYDDDDEDDDEIEPDTDEESDDEDL